MRLRERAVYNDQAVERDPADAGTSGAESEIFFMLWDFGATICIEVQILSEK